MSFNDMNKQLGNAGSNEARIRELSETLLRRGLAMTKESARQLAQSMVETEQRVQKSFQEKKERATTYGDKPIGTLNKSFREAESAARQRETADEYRERALNPAPVDVQIHYDTPTGKEMTVNEAAGLETYSDEPLIEADEDNVQIEHEPEPSQSEQDVELEAYENDIAPVEREEIAVHEESPPPENVPQSSVPADELIDTTSVAMQEEHSPDNEPTTLESEPSPQSPLPVAVDVELREPEQEAGVKDTLYAEHQKPMKTAHGPVVETFHDDTEEDLSSDQNDAVEEIIERPEPTVSEEKVDETASREKAPEKEDLGKKHGIDLGNIFNVNK